MVQVPHILLESVFESPGNRLVTVLSTIVTLHSSNFHIHHSSNTGETEKFYLVGGMPLRPHT